MRFSFQFERKIGWAELLSFFALLVSLAALWFARVQVQQNLPDVSVEERELINLVPSDLAKQTELLATIPIVVTNRGGRTVTLIKIERDSLAPLLRIVNDKITEEHNLEASFAFIEAEPDSKDFLPSKVLTADINPLKLPYVVNQSIESGRARTFALVIRIHDKDGHPISSERIFFSCRLIFSDGSTHRLAHAFGYKE